MKAEAYVWVDTRTLDFAGSAATADHCLPKSNKNLLEAQSQRWRWSQAVAQSPPSQRVSILALINYAPSNTLPDEVAGKEIGMPTLVIRAQYPAPQSALFNGYLVNPLIAKGATSPITLPLC